MNTRIPARVLWCAALGVIVGLLAIAFGVNLAFMRATPPAGGGRPAPVSRADGPNPMGIPREMLTAAGGLDRLRSPDKETRDLGRMQIGLNFHELTDADVWQLLLIVADEKGALTRAERVLIAKGLSAYPVAVHNTVSAEAGRRARVPGEETSQIAAVWAALRMMDPGFEPAAAGSFKDLQRATRDRARDIADDRRWERK